MDDAGDLDVDAADMLDAVESVEHAVGNVQRAVEGVGGSVEKLREQLNTLAWGAGWAALGAVIALILELAPPESHNRRITVYPVRCEGSVENQSCVGRLGAAEPRESFRGIAERQLVVHGIEDGTLERFLDDCVVQDSENWMCAFEDGGRIQTWTMREGNLAKADDASLASGGKPRVFVQWWQWWLHRL